MKILKHGKPEIYNQYTVPYACNRCGCEFEAVAGDMKIEPAEPDPVKQLACMLTNPDKQLEELFVVHCPDCGMRLSKTTTEVDQIGKERENNNAIN